MGRVAGAFADVPTERLVLGAALDQPEGLQRIRLMLAPADFSLREHQVIYRAMLRLVEQGKKVDIATVDAELDARGEIDKAGGPLYVSELIDGIWKLPNIEHYAAIVREKARRRKFGKLCEQLVAELGGPAETDELLRTAYEQLLALRFGQRNGHAPFIRAQEAAQTAWEELDRQAANVKKLTLARSGIRVLDRRTGGFRPKEQIVIAGETSHLKTVLAQQIVRETSKQLSGKQQVLVFSPEMPAVNLMKRQMAAATGISTSLLRRPWKLGLHDLADLKTYADTTQLPILINDDRPLSFERIRAVADLAASRFEIALVVIDYAQLVRYPGKSDLERDSLLAVDSYELADYLNAPVLLLSQLTKPARSLRRFQRKKDQTEEDLFLEQWQCRPTRWDIKGHGALGETPHMIIGTHRHYLHLIEDRELAEPFRNKAEICLLKMRDGGSVGTMEVSFNEELLVLSDPPTAESTAGIEASLPKGDRE